MRRAKGGLRRVLRLWIDGMSVEEIAAATGLEVSTVKVTLSDARALQELAGLRQDHEMATLDIRAAREAGPVTVRAMTEEERVRYVVAPKGEEAAP